MSWEQLFREAQEDCRRRQETIDAIRAENGRLREALDNYFGTIEEGSAGRKHWEKCLAELDAAKEGR